MKTYEYKYEGSVNFGLGKPNLAESGVRMKCNLKIVGVSAKNFIIQVRTHKEEINFNFNVICFAEAAAKFFFMGQMQIISRTGGSKTLNAISYIYL